MNDRISWEEDYQERMNPALLTELLHEAVPVLRYVNWRVLETREGYARTQLPLNCESTNQHGTHQAALIVLAADYTGGIALGTLFRGFPLSGVHPHYSDNNAVLWLVDVKISYKMPSSDHLVVTCQVPSERFSIIRDRFFGERRILEHLDVCFESEGQQIAKATLGYFAQQARCLKPQAPDQAVNALFRHRVKASARLIAGIRARGNGDGQPCPDPLSAQVAGVHGRLLSQRFLALLPQLQDMIAARTRDIDDSLAAALEGGARQLVFVGVGLDCRPFRLLDPRGGVKVFELDLPSMLAERERTLATVENLPAVRRESLKINLELEDPSGALIAAGFDPGVPSFLVCEGLSMYLNDTTNTRLFTSLLGLLKNPDSRLWVDVVSRAVIEGRTGHREAENFLDGMAKLGEPFVFGIDDPAAYFGDLGYECTTVTPCSSYRGETGDPLFLHYRFCLLAAGHP